MSTRRRRQQNEIDCHCRILSDFEEYKILGSGSFGLVIQVTQKLDRKSYALKIIKNGAAEENANMYRKTLDEVRIWVKIPTHSNVVQYITCWEDLIGSRELEVIRNRFPDWGYEICASRLFCIQMELCQGDLREWIGTQKCLDEQNVFDIFLQITKGLEHLHQNKIIHRDLKPDNIFLGQQKSNDGFLKVKIGDFGISTYHHQGPTPANHTVTGTPLYLAPEQETGNYDQAVDLFALGLILFELLHPNLQPGFNHGLWDSLSRAFFELKNYQKFPDTALIQKLPHVSTLILQLIKVDPKERPTISEIYRTFAYPPDIYCCICGDFYSGAENDHFVKQECEAKNSIMQHVLHRSCLEQTIANGNNNPIKCPVCRTVIHLAKVERVNAVKLKPRPDMRHFDQELKIVVLGRYGAGKSCILKRFALNKFTEERKETEGTDYFTKCIQLDKKRIKLNLLDTAGRERYKSLVGNHVKDAFGMLFVYDITEPESFIDILQWVHFAERFGPPPEQTVRILVGNKIDLAEEGRRQVTVSDAQRLVRNRSIDFFECSAKDNYNIAHIFRYLAGKMLEKDIIKRPNEVASFRLDDTSKVGQERRNKCSC